jgi:hypothetical protein
LVARRAVDVAGRVVDPAHGAHVDELHVVADLDQVVGLEVAVEKPAAVEVGERGEDGEDVSDRLIDRQGVGRPAVGRPAGLEDLLERLPTHEFLDDVARALVGHEVEDPDDAGMLDLGEEPTLGDGDGHGRCVPGVEQTFEDHPAVVHCTVLRQVDPTQATVGEATDNLVLAAHQVAPAELGYEVERVAALRAEAPLAAGSAALRSADRGAAARAEPLALGHRWVAQDDARGVDWRGGGNVDQASADRGPAARRAGRSARRPPGAVRPG